MLLLGQVPQGTRTETGGEGCRTYSPLIELLVLIAVIALLMAISTTTLGRARMNDGKEKHGESERP